jgi:hypothetical protein
VQASSACSGSQQSETLRGYLVSTWTHTLYRVDDTHEYIHIRTCFTYILEPTRNIFVATKNRSRCIISNPTCALTSLRACIHSCYILYGLPRDDKFILNDGNPLEQTDVWKHGSTSIPRSLDNHKYRRRSGFGLPFHWWTILLWATSWVLVTGITLSVAGYSMIDGITVMYRI